MGDCNGDIMPALEINDVALPHLGYLTEGIRRDKMLHRNRSCSCAISRSSRIVGSGRCSGSAST
jgi:hypothetical protein